MATKNNILVLGSGELGHAIVTALQNHPSFSSSSHTITTSLRPSTLTSPPPARQPQLSHYRATSVVLLPLDIEATSLAALTTLFTTHAFTTIIHAGATDLRPGEQTKITQAALSTATVSLYIPWQFGIDYDLIGPDAASGIFREQHAIRGLMRAQTRVKWLIVSNGIFMSLLFEPRWGVVENLDGGGDLTMRALGGWEDSLAVTSAEDIGRCTAELVLVDVPRDPAGYRDRAVYISGQSLKYKDLADLVERVTGRAAKRELWTTEHLARESAASPQDKLLQYRVVFSENVGTDWPKDQVYNLQKGIDMVGIEGWLRARGKA